MNKLNEQDHIVDITFDRWGATKLSTDLADAGFKMVPFGQGYASMSAPTNELLNMVISKQIRHGGNPVLRWMADSMDVKQDPAGNIKPVKPDRGKSGKRIDGIVTLLWPSIESSATSIPGQFMRQRDTYLDDAPRSTLCIAPVSRMSPSGHPEIKGNAPRSRNQLMRGNGWVFNRDV